MAANKNLPVWLSPADRRQYEPASIRNYDEHGLVLVSLSAYAEGEEIVIGIGGLLSSQDHNRGTIMDLMKIKIDRREQIETSGDGYFEYKAKYSSAHGQ
ncbi:MAG: hypothetical protein EHM45_15460 [Desulfobacteraceae bacterium]|nr:MAG: hypothetical protein EHM45_15460 [Desulfobacteraceae bacterium]